jgi:hypothetical protein
MPGVPILGARVVATHQLMVHGVLTCDCGSSAPIVVGFLSVRDALVPQPAACPACGQAYMIGRVEFVNVNGACEVTWSVGTLATAPKRPTFTITKEGPHGL